MSGVMRRTPRQAAQVAHDTYMVNGGEAGPLDLFDEVIAYRITIDVQSALLRLYDRALCSPAETGSSCSLHLEERRAAFARK
jgi:hypothetical protein